MEKVLFFYGSYEPILRIIVVGTLTYIFLLFLLRLFGQRTLSQMQSFDFIITIAIGSAYGRILTAKGTALAESATAILLLVFLEYIIDWLSLRSSKFSKWIGNRPILVYFKGEFIREAMEKNRITRKELLAQVRLNQISSLQEVEAIVLEASGKVAVVKKNSESDHSSLESLI